ncbi:MAG: hypothetical protein AABX70_06370 [Nanoarchaeota archaeon]
MTETLEDKCWAVMRQGDEGKPWIITSFLTEQEAATQVEEMDSRGHKQAYWKTLVGSEEYTKAREEGCFQ